MASAFSAEEQLRTFANCAGRLMAQLEHQWVTQVGDPDITQHQRRQIVELLDTITPQDRGREILSWRTDARAAQRALLMRATYGDNTDDATWAAEQADIYLANCTSFLIS